MDISLFRADRYVIGARFATNGVKLFQIVLAPDGSLYVTFPYFRYGGGQLGRVELAAGLTYPNNLSIGELFAVTTHQVKYSHHPSGRAHFSMEKKVRTTIKKDDAVLLSEASGHLFTFMVQGQRQFDSLGPKELSTSKRGVVGFPIDPDSAPALKFVAHYYPLTEWASRIRSSDGKSPWFACDKPDGTRSVGIALATHHSIDGIPRVLMLTAETIPTISLDHKVFMTFLGGFDRHAIVTDPTANTSFLMFIYPMSPDIDVIQALARSIDLPK